MTDSETRTRKQWSDEALTSFYISGLRIVDAPPAGYCVAGRVVEASEKALRFAHRGLLLWIPKSKVVQLRETREFFAPPWFVKTAKRHFSVATIRAAS